MLISCHTFPFFRNFSIKDTIKLIKDAGFDAYDFTMFENKDIKPEYQLYKLDNYIEAAKELREYADSIGIVCNQSHALFRVYLDIPKQEQEKRISYVIRQIEIASILGAKVICIHPINNWDAIKNAEMFKLFEPYAKKFNIKIGIENMWLWDNEHEKAIDAACSFDTDFIKHIDILKSNQFVALVDIGHAEMMSNTNAPQLLRALDFRVGALHIHDNDKIHDDHNFPYFGKIDFDSVISALKDINYKGDLTFEVDRLLHFPKELQLDMAKLLCNIGKDFKRKLQ